MGTYNGIVKARKLTRFACALLVSIISAAAAAAQQSTKPPAGPLTLSKAVDFALANYPAVRASMEQSAAARENVGLARTSYLPRADVLWQSNRATRNNIFGLLLPQSVVPAISGPVLSQSSDRGVWGSAGGMLVSWEPFDFGYRNATVGVAKSAQQRAEAELSLTRLDVAANTADTFLTVAANQQRVTAAQADVDRRLVFAKSVHALVDQELRPGADASRADAELAAARIQLILAEQSERMSKADLEQLLGVAGTRIVIDTDGLVQNTPQAAQVQESLSNHPAALAAAAGISESAAREKVVSKSYYPHFDLQGSFSGRGTGANLDGSFGTGTDGLGIMRHNWAVGLTATFPLMDFASLRFKKGIAQANERAQRARYDQTIQDLTNRSEKAGALYEAAQEVAGNTPVELQAAQQGESQARARYQAGLTTIVEVAEAQRLLLQAQIDDDLARLSVWRGLLAQAFAQGRLEPFLEAVRKGEK